MPSSLLSIAAVVVAAAAFAAVGLLDARRRRLSVEAYISARDSAGTRTAVATVVASAMGAWILYSPAEAGTWGGLPALIGYGLGSAAPMLALIPLGRRMRALVPHGHSLTEFVWARYGRGMYALALVVMVFYMFVFLTAEITGIALAVNLVSGQPLALTAALVGLATLAYTAYGGLPTTVFTDRLQAAIIVPLLVLTFVGVVGALGGPAAVAAQVREGAPALLALGHRPGVEGAATLVIAILGANLFHQGYWQRVYLARDLGVLRRAMWVSALLVVPIVMLPGVLGVVAAATGRAQTPSVAFFSLLLAVAPAWVIVGVLVLAVALAMSSIDTLLNGLAAVFTADLSRLRPAAGPTRLLGWSRLITVGLALAAIALAAQGYSVLYLFLVADLVCVAAAAPTFLGLYARRLAGWAAAGSALAGIAAGALFFPDPDFRRGHLLTAFVLAAAVPSVLAAVLQFAGSPADLERLRARVRPLGEPTDVNPRS